MGVDLDQVFAYKTIKVVKMQDRRLGFVFYGIQMLIILYICVFVFAINEGYLATEMALGQVSEPLVTLIPTFLWSMSNSLSRTLWNGVLKFVEQSLQFFLLLSFTQFGKPPELHDSLIQILEPSPSSKLYYFFLSHTALATFFFLNPPALSHLVLSPACRYTSR
jgi:hypothetical protein